ncbi:MAG TPA: exopolysaccharide biosynthesis protein [Micrococcales bacterium]|nr:exopolysaccharide biosynthesis protein [Micrococcales bacterium]
MTPAPPPPDAAPPDRPDPDPAESAQPAEPAETTAAEQARARAPRRSLARRRRVRRAILAASLTVALSLGGATAWALNRFVIEHVEISDVAAYEEAQRASSDATSDADAAADATTEATSDATASSTSGTAADDGTTASDADTASEPQITITQGTYGSGDDAATYYVADVVVSDITQLRAAFAQNAFGENITEDPSDIASDVGALVAINGDYYGFRDTGIVIRNGVLYRDSPARTGAVIYSDGTMAIYDETTTSGAELIADGAWQTLSFGPALVDDGEIVSGIDQVEVDTNVGNHSIQGDQPRTAIGMISANHYVLVVVDGRSDTSAGVTLTELAEIMQSLGATVAYNLDGGGSSTLVDSDYDVVNTPSNDGERATSDILYVAATTSGSDE